MRYEGRHPDCPDILITPRTFRMKAKNAAGNLGAKIELAVFP
jgi:hypothetical protein